MAPVKLEDSLAMYCVGLPVAVLLSVTVRLDVSAAPLLIWNVDTTGNSLSVMESFTTADSPLAFLTLK